MNKKRIAYYLRKAVRVACLGGGALVLLTVLAFLATAIYETLAPPTDMYLPGLLTAAMMLYVAPVGCILFVLGGMIWIGMSFVGRRLERQPTDRD